MSARASAAPRLTPIPVVEPSAQKASGNGIQVQVPAGATMGPVVAASGPAPPASEPPEPAASELVAASEWACPPPQAQGAKTAKKTAKTPAKTPALDAKMESLLTAATTSSGGGFR